MKFFTYAQLLMATVAMTSLGSGVTAQPLQSMVQVAATDDHDHEKPGADKAEGGQASHESEEEEEGVLR